MSRMESGTVHVLKSVELFSGLSPEMLQMVADNCTPIRRKKGSTIMHQGEPGSTMYVILKGRVKVTYTNEHFEEVFIAERIPHECIGEMSLLDGSPRSADVTATTDCELIVLDREPLIRLLRDSPELALRIMSTLIRRIREFDKDRGRRPVRAKLAEKLLELAHQFGKETPKGIRIESDMTKTELAKRINAAREVVSRTFADLKDEGIVAQDGKVIVILDKDRLTRVSHG